MGTGNMMCILGATLIVLAIVNGEITSLNNEDAKGDFGKSKRFFGFFSNLLNIFSEGFRRPAPAFAATLPALVTFTKPPQSTTAITTTAAITLTPAVSVTSSTPLTAAEIENLKSTLGMLEGVLLTLPGGSDKTAVQNEINTLKAQLGIK